MLRFLAQRAAGSLEYAAVSALRPALLSMRGCEDGLLAPSPTTTVRALQRGGKPGLHGAKETSCAAVLEGLTPMRRTFSAICWDRRRLADSGRRGESVRRKPCPRLKPRPGRQRLFLAYMPVYSPVLFLSVIVGVTQIARRTEQGQMRNSF